jgi:prevent-host-death family protein
MAINLAIIGTAMTTVSIAEAKNQLPRIVQQVETGSPVHITRHGKPVAVLVSEAEYERLRAGQAEPKSLWDTVEEWRGSNAFDWPALTDEEVDGWRDRTPPREFSWDD